MSLRLVQRPSLWSRMAAPFRRSLCRGNRATAQANTRALLTAFRSVTTLTAHPVDPAVYLFAERLLSTAHRDATHQPYGEWFTLYVRLRSGWKAASSSTLRSAAQSDAAEQQHRVKAAIDALLWTSLFARHWTEVRVEALLPSTASHYRWWWSAETHLRHAPTLEAAPLELCTAAFLAEPLLGGRCLQQWMEDVRRSSATGAATSASPTVDGSQLDTPTVVLPFSAVWAIKHSAYWRPSSPSLSLPSRGAAAAPPSLSLQERQARQSLLHAIDQLLQLQVDAAAHRGSPSQRLCVLSPTEEWDLLCDAPRLRQALIPPSASVAVPPWLSLGSLCEDGLARLAYCAHALDLQQQQQQRQRPQSGETLSSAPPRPSVRVLSPSSEHAHLRSFALTAVHEHSATRTALHQRHSTRPPSASAVCIGAAATTVHGQARKGCSDAVRRMSTREENIRQSFAVR